MKTKFKTTLQRHALEGLEEVIVKALQYNAGTDDDKLLLCVLDSILKKIQLKLLLYKPTYNLKLEHEQAIALRMLYTYFVQENKSYMGAKLHLIANQIHQHFY